MAQLLFVVIGYFLGINFPDIDQKIKFIGHRSFITHSPIVTFILFYFVGKKNVDFHYFLQGFSFAIGIHLLFDLFPKAWFGNALIKPMGGIFFSKLYIFTSIIISFVFAFKIVQNINNYIVLVVIGFIAVLTYSFKEKVLIKPLVIYSLITYTIGVFQYKNFLNTVIKISNEYVKVYIKNYI